MEKQGTYELLKVWSITLNDSVDIESVDGAIKIINLKTGEVHLPHIELVAVNKVTATSRQPLDGARLSHSGGEYD